MKHGKTRGSSSKHPFLQAPEVGWALARQCAAVLWSTQVGTQTAAAGIQCRFCALVRGVGLFLWMLLVTWSADRRFVLHLLRNLHVPWKNGGPEGWRSFQNQRGRLSSMLSGVRELFVAQFRTSNSHRSNRAARNHYRTVVFFAAWTTPAHSMADATAILFFLFSRSLVSKGSEKPEHITSHNRRPKLGTEVGLCRRRCLQLVRSTPLGIRAAFVFWGQVLASFRSCQWRCKEQT